MLNNNFYHYLCRVAIHASNLFIVNSLHTNNMYLNFIQSKKQQPMWGIVNIEDNHCLSFQIENHPKRIYHMRAFDGPRCFQLEFLPSSNKIALKWVYSIAGYPKTIEIDAKGINLSFFDDLKDFEYIPYPNTPQGQEIGLIVSKDELRRRLIVWNQFNPDTVSQSIDTLYEMYRITSYLLCVSKMLFDIATPSFFSRKYNYPKTLNLYINFPGTPVSKELFRRLLLPFCLSDSNKHNWNILICDENVSPQQM